MQWLLRLIRGAAGDAHATLAAVPESVVRDAAGWLTFVIRWGHADLLGGCDIGGLVQVAVLSARMCVESQRAGTGSMSLRSTGRIKPAAAKCTAAPARDIIRDICLLSIVKIQASCLQINVVVSAKDGFCGPQVASSPAELLTV